MTAQSLSTKPAANVRPTKFAHVVLRTTKARYAPMVEWYRQVLNARVVQSSAMMTFLSYDEEHHRIAIFNAPDAAPKNPHASGLDHLAFTYGSLADLLATHARLRTAGIEPFCPVNHGPTTSLYYLDPDRNRVELQIDNYQDLEECVRQMAKSANPFGRLIDPDALAARLEAGESQDDIVQLTPAQIGPLDPVLAEKIMTK